MSRTDRLLRSVATRQRINGVLRWFARLVLVLGAVYAAVLIASVLSLIPLKLDPLMALVVPAAAMLLAMIVYRSGGAESAARLVDQRMNMKDLFLTATRLATAPGDYKPLVARAAEVNAQRIKPQAVAPVRWRDSTTWAAGTVLFLVVCTWGVPTFDPFGVHAEKAKVEARKKELAEQKNFAAERIKALSNEPLSDEVSDKVEQALKELQQSFEQMKPADIKPNLARLNEHQKQIGEQWRKLGEQNLKALEPSDSIQRFGQANPEAREWKKQLEQGDASGLRKEMEAARDLLRKLGEAKDPQEQRDLKAALEKKLRALEEFAQNEAKSDGLESALKKAMEQLQSMDKQGLSDEAREALDSSLELAKVELEALAQSVRDLESLEEALKLIAMAKVANAKGKLGDLGDKPSPGTLEGYRELYEAMVKEMGGEGMCSACNGTGKIEGKAGVCPFCKGSGKSGLGMGGPGQGEGGVAPEDDSVETGFKTEKSKTTLQAGKMLLTWKESELPESGEAQANYADLVMSIKQGVSESILTEQVPPGYHEAIKKYFDAIDADGKK